jgi:hypothetical protein
MAFRFRKDSKEEFEKLGYSDLRWDEEYLQPPEGFPPIKTEKNPGAVWDEILWPLSPSKGRPRVRLLGFSICAMCTHLLDQRLIMKGKAKEKFLVGPNQYSPMVPV